MLLLRLHLHNSATTVLFGLEKQIVSLIDAASEVISVVQLCEFGAEGELEMIFAVADSG